MFYYNYVEQCNRKGISPSAAAEAMGIHKSQVTRWSQNPETKPRMSNLLKMTAYFGCTLEDLIGTNEKTATHTDDGLLPEDIKSQLLKMSRADLIDLIAEATAVLKDK